MVVTINVPGAPNLIGQDPGGKLMEKIEIQFTLFSAFYSPLIAAMAGGFLKAEGIDASWSVAPPGVSAIKALEEGTAQVIQSAPSQGFTSLAKGETPVAVHFAQINEMDGFFLTGRQPDPDFSWKSLEGAEVVCFAGGQPRAMFQYACHKAGIDFRKIKTITPGGAGDIDKAFRDGQGAYVQQQGPFPQQLEADGAGHIVTQVGKQIGPVAFSSLASTREWLTTDTAKAFMRAYRKTRIYMNETPAAEIAASQKSYFPKIDEAVLAKCIGTYQQLGCWTPHVEITRPTFEVALDVFEHFGTLKERYAYEQVCALPPEG
jgi:NitT/TauT family transport system substrate-binding protein